jgi:hypothetical protein
MQSPTALPLLLPVPDSLAPAYRCHANISEYTGRIVACQCLQVRSHTCLLRATQQVHTKTLITIATMYQSTSPTSEAGIDDAKRDVTLRLSAPAPPSKTELEIANRAAKSLRRVCYIRDSDTSSISISGHIHIFKAGH